VEFWVSRMRLEANIDSELNVPVRLTDVHSSSAIEVCSQELALDDLPNDLTRMLYLASLRDCNSGRYLHPQFSQKLGGEEADHAIGACPTLGSLCRRTDRLIGRSRKACHANTRPCFARCRLDDRFRREQVVHAVIVGSDHRVRVSHRINFGHPCCPRSGRRLTDDSTYYVASSVERGFAVLLSNSSDLSVVAE